MKEIKKKIWMLHIVRQKIDTVLTYPNYILLADETGCNTNKKKDRHIAGTKYATKKEHGHKECHLLPKDALRSFNPFLLMESQCVELLFFSQNNILPISNGHMALI